jgi:hypothetical protein
MGRSIHGPDEFFKKLKKKPALQSILDNIDNYTESDIDKLSQPLWIRTELKRQILSRQTLKYLGIETSNTSITKNEAAMLLADMMEKNTVINPAFQELYTKEYDVVEWINTTWQMPYSFSKVGAGSTIDVEPGDIFLILNLAERILLYEHRFVKLDNTGFDYFLKHVMLLNVKKTIKDYKLFNMERLEIKHGFKKKEENDVPEIYRNKPKHPYEHLIKDQRRFTSDDFR